MKLDRFAQVSSLKARGCEKDKVRCLIALGKATDLADDEIRLYSFFLKTFQNLTKYFKFIYL